MNNVQNSHSIAAVYLLHITQGIVSTLYIVEKTLYYEMFMSSEVNLVFVDLLCITLFVIYYSTNSPLYLVMKILYCQMTSAKRNSNQICNSGI